MMIRKLTLCLIIPFVLSCNKESKLKKLPSERKSSLHFDIDFPSTVYTHKKYKGKITFYNAMLDTIAEPRRDTTNFRFIIYKPFKPYMYGENTSPIYKDSVLLDKNTIDIEFTFDKSGIYNIGGFARDAIMIGYYTNGVRDSVRIIEHETILFYKVIAKDSI